MCGMLKVEDYSVSYSSSKQELSNDTSSDLPIHRDRTQSLHPEQECDVKTTQDRLSSDIRKKIWQHRLDNPAMSQKRIEDWVRNEFHISIPQSAVSRLCKNLNRRWQHTEI